MGLITISLFQPKRAMSSHIDQQVLERVVSESVVSLCGSNISNWHHLAVQGLLVVTVNHDQVCVLNLSAHTSSGKPSIQLYSMTIPPIYHYVCI